MAGHSHWKTIKRKKEAQDKKRGNIFSKITQEIIGAVKEKGKDISFNPRLKTLIEKAKKYNLPKDNMERAIKRGEELHNPRNLCQKKVLSEKK
jgi:transcriptional/translational regulatory protein YebC/TACO1